MSVLCTYVHVHVCVHVYVCACVSACDPVGNVGRCGGGRSGSRWCGGGRSE